MKIRNNRGFSLIEILIVIAILAIGAAIAAPNFTRYLHNSNLKTAGRDLAGDIYYTKQSAAAESVHYKITFNQSANNYQIAKGGVNAADAYVTIATKSLGSVASYITTDNITYGSGEIVFQPRGTTSPTGGEVRLKNDLGSTITIKTTILGKVSVQTTLK